MGCFKTPSGCLKQNTILFSISLTICFLIRVFSPFIFNEIINMVGFKYPIIVLSFHLSSLLLILYYSYPVVADCISQRQLHRYTCSHTHTCFIPHAFFKKNNVTNNSPTVRSGLCSLYLNFNGDLQLLQPI